MLLRRTEELGRLWEAIDDLLDQHGLPARAADALTLAAEGYALTNEGYRSAADVTASTAGRDLRALADAGLVQPHGEKRGRSYTAGPTLRHLRRDAATAIRAEERIDPYTDPDLMVDPYAQPSLFET